MVMKRIAFLVLYFGKLPANFPLWLKSCEFNPQIDFILFTDDNTKYRYPDNVHVKYCSYEYIKHRISNHFRFPIVIDRPWCLCLYRPAYGEIFAEELKGYDFWGHCDIDLLWGNMQNYYTDEIMEKYERIGSKGHSTLYRNIPEVNERYKVCVPNAIDYRSAYSGNYDYAFDENGMDSIYDYLGIPYYQEPIYAHLEKYEPSFYLARLPKEKLYTNRFQVFEWNKGSLKRYYIDNGKIEQQEYLYVHFFCRPMKYDVNEWEAHDRYIIYPDVVKPFSGKIDIKYIKKYGKQGKIAFYSKIIWTNRHKFTWKRIKKNITYYFIWKTKKKMRDEPRSI